MADFRRSALVVLVALSAPPAAAQFKTPVPIVSPTPTPGFTPKEYQPRTPKEAPTHAAPAPTRTPTPTPPPLDTRFVGPSWGPEQRAVPIAVRRLDAHSQCKSSSDVLNSGKVRIAIDCYAQGYGPLGLKVDADVAAGIRLKNGWKVKNFQMGAALGTEPPNPDATHGFRVTKAPIVGSDDPSFSLHLFSDRFKGIVVEGGVQIEGPRGTTPW